MKVMNLLDRLSGKVRRRTIVKRSSEWRGTIADSESLRRALEGKSLTNVGIIAREGREMRSLSQLVQNKGAKVVFQHVLTDNCEDVDLSNIDQVEQIVLAVFDTAVYRLRYRILQSLRGGTTEIIAPAYPYQPLVEDDWFNKIITNLADKTEWDVAFWQSWKSYGVYQLLRLALRLEGDCYEFGCYRGYSAAFLAETMQVLNVRNKKIVLFDTWEGMPSSDKAADSFYRSGDFADTALETVQRALNPGRIVSSISRAIYAKRYHFKGPAHCAMRVLMWTCTRQPGLPWRQFTIGLLRVALSTLTTMCQRRRLASALPWMRCSLTDQSDRSTCWATVLISSREWISVSCWSNAFLANVPHRWQLSITGGQYHPGSQNGRRLHPLAA